MNKKMVEYAGIASDPFQFLSKAILIPSIDSMMDNLKPDEPDEVFFYKASSLILYLNSIPVSQDASASAYQLMSFILANVQMGKHTNMIPVDAGENLSEAMEKNSAYGQASEEIQDLYSSLKDELVEYLIKRKSGDTDCLHFIKTQIDRKFVKRLFMPLIYGKTKIAMSNDIRELSGMRLPHKAYYEISSDCYDFWNEKYSDIVNLMAMMNLIGWFMSRMNKKVVYGHLFFTTHQFYTKSLGTSINIFSKITKKRHRVSLKVCTSEPDIRKSAVYTCVNFIHQRDAYIAMNVVYKLIYKYPNASIYTVNENLITSPIYANIPYFSLPSLYTDSFLSMENPKDIVMKFLMNNLIHNESESKKKKSENYQTISYLHLCDIIYKVCEKKEQPLIIQDILHICNFLIQERKMNSHYQFRYKSDELVAKQHLYNRYSDLLGDFTRHEKY